VPRPAALFFSARIFYGTTEIKGGTGPVRFSTWLLHWLTAALVAAGFLFWVPRSLLDYFQGRGHFWHDVHVSVGVLALALVLARLLLRLVVPGRPMARLRGQRMARTVQLTLLILIIALAVSGYLAFRQPALGMKVMLFGQWALPDINWIGTARAWRSAHTILSYALLGVLAVHILLGLRRSSITQRRPIATMLWPWPSRRALREA
jgi:cytochrome b561